MTERRVEDLYFQWLVDLIDDGDVDDYMDVLELLFHIDFIWSMDMDSNRAAYGLELRERFVKEEDYGDRIFKYMPDRPCSVLEMLIGLSESCETVAGDSIDWFWFMFKNLGLKDCRNGEFSQASVRRKIDIFLNRSFRPDGKGGLFFIRNSENDLTKIDIWNQFMFYLNSKYDDI